MHSILGHLSYVEIYLDDITVHSASFKDHISHVRDVLNRLKQAKLKIKLSKCNFFAKKVRMLGHIISGDKIETSPHIIEALVK